MQDLAVEPALVGRGNELASLRSGLRDRASRLILGPAGIGKTRILTDALAASDEPFVLIEKPLVVHELLVTLARRLECDSLRFPDLRRATSIHLKPLILNTLRQKPRCVILENVEAVEPRMYRFLQELYYVPDACLIVTARSRECIGHLAKLLWDPREEIALPPLTNAESLQLFADACQLFGVESTDLLDFQRKAIRSARGNPCQIVGMCRLAAKPEYRSGKYIKFAPLRIDLLAGLVP